MNHDSALKQIEDIDRGFRALADRVAKATGKDVKVVEGVFLLAAAPWSVQCVPWATGLQKLLHDYRHIQVARMGLWAAAEGGYYFGRKREKPVVNFNPITVSYEKGVRRRGKPKRKRRRSRR